MMDGEGGDFYVIKGEGAWSENVGDSATHYYSTAENRDFYYDQSEAPIFRNPEGHY